MNPRFKTLVCAMLSLVLAFSLVVPAFAITSGETSANHNNCVNEEQFPVCNIPESEDPDENIGIDDDETVDVIIHLSGASIIDQKTIVPSLISAATSEKALEAKQDTFAQEAEDNGIDMDVQYNYTAVMNGIGVTMRYGDLEKLRAMDGVESAWVATEYNLPEDHLDMAAANQMTGASYLQELDNKGAGMVIAIIDSGINFNHYAFTGYGETVNPKLSKADITSFGNQYLRGYNGYHSEKIPFARNYATSRPADVSDLIGHGTHVAGIAAGYEETPDGVPVFSGVAPAAQLLIMNVFGNSAHTNSTIYLAALDNAYTLGADVINMSLGSTAGFTADKELESRELGNVYKKLEDAGIILCVSAGNDATSGYGNINEYDLPRAEYTDYGTVSSPSTYAGNLSVAGTDNIWDKLNTFTVGTKTYSYIDNSVAADKAFANLAGTYEYAVLSSSSQYTEAELKNLSGKIAVAFLEASSDSLKEKTALIAKAGAVGIIFCSRYDNAFNVHLDDYSIPVVTAPKDAADMLKNSVNSKTGTGKLTVNPLSDTVKNASAWRMDEYSSWGCTPDLKLKPQISAPGSDIRSAYFAASAAGTIRRQSYVSYSGTSMASPNVVGNMALLLEHLKSVYPYKTKLDRAALAEDLILSTAHILQDDGGRVYSPRYQGTGFIQTYSAVKAAAYLENPIIELGDDPAKAGVYKLDYTVTNLSGKSISYRVDTVALCDRLWTDTKTGIKYNTLTSEAMIANGWAEFSVSDSVNNTITVPANGSTAFTVTVTLTAKGRDALSNFPNGTFVEGYVTLTSDNGAEPIHGTFMGYYGDWTAAPMIEDNAAPLNSGANYTETVFTNESGMRELAKANDNFFDSNVKGPGDCFCITNQPSVGGVNQKHSVYLAPMLLRNLRTMTVRVYGVSNGKMNGQVYYKKVYEYIPKAIYDYSCENFCAPVEIIWDGVDAGNRPLPDGTQVILEVSGTLDYAGAAERVLMSSPIITIDNRLPDISATWSSDAPDKLAFDFSDNYYLMYADISEVTDDTSDAAKYDMKKAFSGEKVSSYVLDLSSVSDSTDALNAEAYDYAGNVYSYTVNVGDQFPVDVTADDGGTVTLHMNGKQIVADIAPDNGKSVKNVMIDGVNHGSIQSYTFTDLRKVHTLKASFISDTDGSAREDTDGLDLTPGAYYASAYSGTYDGKSDITVKAGSDVKSIKYGTTSGSRILSYLQALYSKYFI